MIKMEAMIPYVLGAFHFTIGVLMYLFIDIGLERFHYLNHTKDLKMMKTVHDLKNPIHSINSIIHDDTLSIKEMRVATNNEIEDLQDMLDGLRLEFKLNEGMSINENKREVDSSEFLKGFKRSMKLLAKNGKNRLTVETDENYPNKLLLQQLNVKRILNNLLSNALKHTTNGNVSLYSEIIGPDALFSDDTDS